MKNIYQKYYTILDTEVLNWLACGKEWGSGALHFGKSQHCIIQGLEILAQKLCNFMIPLSRDFHIVNINQGLTYQDMPYQLLFWCLRFGLWSQILWVGKGNPQNYVKRSQLPTNTGAQVRWWPPWSWESSVFRPYMEQCGDSYERKLAIKVKGTGNKGDAFEICYICILFSITEVTMVYLGFPGGLWTQNLAKCSHHVCRT